MSEAPADSRSCYVYAVISTPCPAAFAVPGHAASAVYTLATGDLAAVIEDLPDPPPDLADPAHLEKHLRRHQQVLETVMAEMPGLLPVRFGTLFKAAAPASAQAAVQTWLGSARDHLQDRLAELSGCCEYAVEVLRERQAAEDELLDTAPVANLQEELQTSGPGKQFLLRRKLARTLTGALHQQSERYAAEMLGVLSRHSRQVQSEPTKPAAAGEWEPVGKFACLLPRVQAEPLEQELAAAAARHGLRCRITGPWPPYSFV